MISSWRRKKSNQQQQPRNKLRGRPDNGGMELTIPNNFRCPISLNLMKDPVTLSTGITYDRDSIETWFDNGNKTCPFTNQVLTSFEPIPNHELRKTIQDWCVERRFYGIERIPTPRIPVSSVQVSQINSKIILGYKRGDTISCLELIGKIKKLAKESERNKKCFAGNGTRAVLSIAFEAFAKASFTENITILEEILSTLSLFFPLDGEAKSHLGSSVSLRCMVWIMKSGELSTKRNAVVALKDVLTLNQTKVKTVEEINGVVEALVKLIKEPICPPATKAALMVIFYMISNSSKTITSFVEKGLVSLLIELLVDCDRSLCEKALVVLDAICAYEEGREKACDHELTIPVLVKKILRVSDLATNFSISTIWKLGKNEDRKESVLVQALQVGAFQKLLLLLQVGSTERTKEKATDLLKLMNIHRERLECIDSMDFKNLKRPF